MKKKGMMEELSESDASDKAKSMGLDYMKFGRYGKDGKVTHKNIGGNLTKVDKDEKPVDEPDTPKDEPKKDEPKKPEVPYGLDTQKMQNDLEGIVTDGIIDVEFDDADGSINMNKEYEPSQDYEAERDMEAIIDYLEKKGVSPDDASIGIDGGEDDGYLSLSVMVTPKGSNTFKKEEMAKDKAYAIGMATAKKKYNDEPPLEKKTIKKGHEIADKLMGMKKEETIIEQMKTIKLRNGAKVLDKVYPNMTMARNAASSLMTQHKGVKADGYQSPFNNRFYVRIRENAPTLTDLERLKKQGLKPKKEEVENNSAKMKYEQIAGLKKKAEKSGMPYSILKKVYDRGMAAWRGGHRPGASQQQWAFARVNSFVTKSSGTWGGADKDLAKQVRGK